MSFASTAAVLDSLKARIEALTPTTQDGVEDLFRVTIGLNPLITSGSRAILLSGSAGVRKPTGNRMCAEWLTNIEITTYYNDIPTEDGQQTVLQRALADAEDMLDDLYDWATTTDGIFQIDPDQAQPIGSGDGELQISRAIRVNFQRT